jgi:hypothetical protein
VKASKLTPGTSTVATIHKIHQLETMRIKRAQVTHFLVLPTEVQRPEHDSALLSATTPFQTDAARRTYRRTSFALLRETIHFTCWKMDEIS